MSKEAKAINNRPLPVLSKPNKAIDLAPLQKFEDDMDVLRQLNHDYSPYAFPQPSLEQGEQLKKEIAICQKKLLPIWNIRCQPADKSCIRNISAMLTAGFPNLTNVQMTEFIQLLAGIIANKKPTKY